MKSTMSPIVYKWPTILFPKEAMICIFKLTAQLEGDSMLHLMINFRHMHVELLFAVFNTEHSSVLPGLAALSYDRFQHAKQPLAIQGGSLM